MSSPDLFEFTDYREYLRAWFKAKKEGNSNFSHRVFARLAGQSSPSGLLNVMQGRRALSLPNAQRYAKALKLTLLETEHFIDLVRMAHEDREEDREAAALRVMSRRNFRAAERLKDERLILISRWYYLAIHELACHPGFRMDPAWVASALRPGITEEQAATALEVLVEEGMLEVHEDGSVSPRDPTLVTEHEASQFVNSYHHQMLEHGGQALVDCAPEERYFGGLTVSVTPELLPQLRREIMSFQERILHICDTAREGRVDEVSVHQLCLQFFPMSTWKAVGGDE
jgi:uncharacterized protein (TIGR02147 family)